MPDDIGTLVRRAIVGVARLTPVLRRPFRALDELRSANAVLADERNQAIVAQQASDRRFEQAEEARWQAERERKAAEGARWQAEKESEEAVRERLRAERQREVAESAGRQAVADREETERGCWQAEKDLQERESKFIPLPGTQYSRYALPLDYLPSRDMRARWGYSRPPIPALHSWFVSHADDYRDFVSEMRKCGADLRDVAHTFDPAFLPAPAWMGTAMNPIDTLALYTFVRKHKPATYLEIGSGITTCFAHLARQHGGLSTKIISIDPEPRTGVDAICDTIIRDGLETCDLGIFAQLEPGDIVFLDGSHRVFMNSDVTVFFIDVLPMLKDGVIVHIHDIMLPWDYPQSFANWYWSEQYMLAVYMMAGKQRLKPLFPSAFVTADPLFADDFAKPLIDLPFSLPWGGGGSMWFTHSATK